ncbi:LysR family transcriptional regulator [Pseudomonas cavernicola]|uniref:LysR family transcriptional regulator n=1 Tax=Pseudomonas cavernicola TaxID=2320866 RepID=A0A418X9E6_9PSED|nr:LysR family transcriptional regulator [Pseudomonas cavernicola]RJG09119.1 LysR family transcriptional regulator [Pseudomonas cavernicola]
MDLSALEIFRAVAQERSITRAALRLDRVQSNVTTRIRQLEEELGVQLFLRDGKRMTLTDRGQHFLEYTEKLLALAEEARQSMHPDIPSGHLRIGSMESTAASRLPSLLAQYHGQWPGVSLEVTTGPSRDLLEALQERRLDCALIANPVTLTAGQWVAEALASGLQGETVFTEELLLVMPAQHPRVHGPADVKIRTLAGFSRACTYRQVAENWLCSHVEGVQKNLKVQEVGSYHSILACISAGSCVGILPRSVLELQREPPKVRTHPVMNIDTQLVWRTGYGTAAFESFRDLLQSSYQSLAATARTVPM